MTTDVDPALKDRVARHHTRFSPHYAGFLSDHGPMAALALCALGADGPTACAWLDNYSERLLPRQAAPAGYLHHLERTLAEIAGRGPDAVLADELPALISGWARDAYHPLIRTAYGVEFGIDEEVAAGLAYLRWCGRDETVEEQARRAERIPDAGAAFARMRPCATSVSPDRNFNRCLAHVIGHPGFETAVVPAATPFASVAKQALDVFATTHGFFALHLVTGSHAYSVLYPYAGELRDPIFALGILAGYAAVGAPEYARAPTAEDADGDWLSLVGVGHPGADEHDLKIAHSAEQLSARLNEPAFTAAALRYLTARRSRTQYPAP